MLQATFSKNVIKYVIFHVKYGVSQTSEVVAMLGLTEVMGLILKSLCLIKDHAVKTYGGVEA
jgi:hypothetical protein